MRFHPLYLLVMKNRFTLSIAIILLSLACSSVHAQTDPSTTKEVSEIKESPIRKNIIRYNLSGALLLGADRYIVFGYERLINKKQSFSINIGSVALAKSSKESVTSGDFTFRNDPKSSGFNVSADYRFYLQKENKFDAPHGLYWGPYVSYNQFNRESIWFNDSTSSQDKTVNTKLNMKIFTAGVELGYQFILWKRLALDFLLIGPGIGSYDINLSTSTNLTEEEKVKLREKVKQVVSEKFVGLNYVLANKHFDTEGTIHTWSYGFRYILHIGFLF
jgi:hypothetical protein